MSCMGQVRPAASRRTTALLARKLSVEREVAIHALARAQAALRRRQQEADGFIATKEAALGSLGALERGNRSIGLRFLVQVEQQSAQAAVVLGAAQEGVASARRSCIDSDRALSLVHRLQASVEDEAQAQQARRAAREADLAWLARWGMPG